MTSQYPTIMEAARAAPRIEGMDVPGGAEAGLPDAGLTETGLTETGLAKAGLAGTGLLVDLASRVVGGSVVSASDELFGERENLIKPEPPVFAPDAFGHKGKVYDGWETRRRRDPGHDTAVIRLGLPGVIHRVTVDTDFFTGNFPPQVSVEACGLEGYPSPDELDRAEWATIVPKSPVKGDAANVFRVTAGQRFTHLRLSIYPDGGVARLRAHGTAVPDPRLLTGVVNLAALENGASVTGYSDMFYSSPANLIVPGWAGRMSDGWETARRRDAGNDWVTLALACAGQPQLAELDTTHFKGNAPGWARLRGTTPGADPADESAWLDVLPRVRLQPDTRHRFPLADVPAISQLRLDIYPDGGMARLRLFGTPLPDSKAALGLRWLNLLPLAQGAEVLRGCCAARPWAAALLAGRPYPAEVDLLTASDTAIAAMDEATVGQALAAHPRIGEQPAAILHAAEQQSSRREQAGMAGADEQLRAGLRAANAAYEDRFGHVYLVCATGLTAAQLLRICTERLGHDPDTERQVVRGELAKITRLRLSRLLR